MREHLRIDTFKVFSDDDKHLRLVMATEKTKNKSEAYRIALETYSSNKSTAYALQALSTHVDSTRTDIKELAERNQDLYFVVRNQAQEICDLKAAIEQQTALLHQVLNHLKGAAN